MKEVNQILIEIRENVNKGTYSSLRNSIRSLTDACKIFLTEFQDLIPSIKIKNLPLERKFDIVVVFVPELGDNLVFFKEVHEYRNLVDHNDSFIPNDQRILRLVIRFEEIISNWEEKAKNYNQTPLENKNYFVNSYHKELDTARKLLEETKNLQIESDVDLSSYIIEKKEIDR